MKQPLDVLLRTLQCIPPELQASLRKQLVASVSVHLDRTKFTDPRRDKPLSEWPYLWDALVWTPSLKTDLSIQDFYSRYGTCYVLSDSLEDEGWIVPLNHAQHLAHYDVYLIPVDSRSVCYVETHERASGLGPFLLDLVPANERDAG